MLIISNYFPKRKRKQQALSLGNILKETHEAPGVFSGGESRDVVCPSLQSSGVLALASCIPYSLTILWHSIMPPLGQSAVWFH